MTTTEFSTTLLVNQSPEEVFNAINNPAAWWSGEIKGSTAKLNDEFTYRYKDLHFSTQRIVEMIPGQKIVWLVTESLLNYAEDKSEWAGTKIIFEIAERDNKPDSYRTRLRFSHLGLVPEVECFESCSNAWTQLIQQSLFSLITTGKTELIALDEPGKTKDEFESASMK